MKTKRIIWTVIFLGITLVAIVMEVIAGVWHVGGTIPWTEYIAAYVPWPIQLLAYVVLAVWLPFHFWRHDHLAKRAYVRGYTARRMDEMTERARARRIAAEKRLAGGPSCSHGYVFGSADSHHCGELPSDARS